MTQHRPLSDRENSGKPPSLSRHNSVPHGVHASMESVQPATGEPRVDRILPQAQLDQLRSRHHPILPPREFAHFAICRTSLQFPADMAGGCKLAGAMPWHAVSLALASARVVR